MWLLVVCFEIVSVRPGLRHCCCPDVRIQKLTPLIVAPVCVRELTNAFDHRAGLCLKLTNAFGYRAGPCSKTD